MDFLDLVVSLVPAGILMLDSWLICNKAVAVYGPT
jgi:hypothetical protein